MKSKLHGVGRLEKTSQKTLWMGGKGGNNEKKLTVEKCCQNIFGDCKMKIKSKSRK